MFGVDHSEAIRDFLRLVKISPPRPSPEGLGELARAFMRLPYENLTKIVRASEEADPAKRLRLPDVIVGDHIELGAGGTCFSLTHFFRAVLERCGYKAKPVMCDRSYGPDTHCALIVELDRQRYLVDPGYLLEHPLPLPVHGTQTIEAKHARTHLTRLGTTQQYLLSTQQGGRSTIRYRLKDYRIIDEDFRERWLDSFSWAQMNHLCITRLEQTGHIYLRDAHLRHSTFEKRSSEKITNGFDRMIHQTFGIDKKLVQRAQEINLRTKQRRVR